MNLNSIKSFGIFIGRETISTTIMVGVIVGVSYGAVKSGVPQAMLDKYLGDDKSIKIEDPALTCDGKMYDKVFKSCKNDIVNSHYDLYKKGDNRLLVNTHCEGIATALTCELIETGNATTDEINKLRVMSVPSNETILAQNK